MLSQKPWKLEAVMRLGMSVLICIFIGSLVSVTISYFRGPDQVHTGLFIFALIVAVVLFAGGLWTLRKPWTLLELPRVLLALLVCVYGGFACMWWAMYLSGQSAGTESGTLKTAIAVASFQGAAMVFVHRFLREHQVSWAEAFGFDFEWRRAVLLGVLVAFVVLPAGWGLQLASAALLERVHVQPQEQEAVRVLRATGTAANRALLGAVAILIAPVAEEILFRGILYPVIKQRGFPRLALWGTSLLFGAIHMNAATFIPLTLLALALIWLYEHTDNLLASITAHSLFNTANFVMLFVMESANHIPVPKS